MPDFTEMKKEPSLKDTEKQDVNLDEKEKLILMLQLSRIFSGGLIASIVLSVLFAASPLFYFIIPFIIAFFITLVACPWLLNVKPNSFSRIIWTIFWISLALGFVVGIYGLLAQ